MLHEQNDECVVNSMLHEQKQGRGWHRALARRNPKDGCSTRLMFRLALLPGAGMLSRTSYPYAGGSAKEKNAMRQKDTHIHRTDVHLCFHV